MPKPAGRSRSGGRASESGESNASGNEPTSEENAMAGKTDYATTLASVEGLSSGADGGSGVYIVERESSPGETRRSRAANVVQDVEEKARKAMNPLLEQVTLVVYGWQSVEPGTLSWVFPSVGAAVAAARAMKNAVRWAIVAGRRESDADDGTDDESGADHALDAARASGAVLIEQAG